MVTEVELLQIGQVAEVVELSLRTIRHYDEVGLVLPSGRSEGGFRLYSRRDVERLMFVKQMKPMEFTLEEMRELLEVRDHLAAGGLDPGMRNRLLDWMVAFVSVAEQRCARLRAQLQMAESLTAMLRKEARGTQPNAG